MGTDVCLLELTREKFAVGCVADADCGKMAVDSNCLGHGLCEPKPAVIVALAAACEAAVAAGLAVCCAQISCAGGGSCAPLETTARCDQGSLITR